jgi:hypothetical protein
MENSPRKIKKILSGIQYMHDCETSTKEQQAEQDSHMPIDVTASNRFEEDIDSDFSEGKVENDIELTEQFLKNFEKNDTPVREAENGCEAIRIAKLAGIFPDDKLRWHISDMKPVIATSEDLHKLLNWKTQMKDDVEKLNQILHIPETDIAGSVSRLTMDDVPAVEHCSVDLQNMDGPNSEQLLPPVDVLQLTADQRRAYDIIRCHLDQTLASNSPTPLCMIIYRKVEPENRESFKL